LVSVELYNGNPIFGIGLFVPCVNVYYDSEYSGKCKVNFFEDYFESDIFNITKFGSKWESLIKNFKEKIEKEVLKRGSLHSNMLPKNFIEKKELYYTQLAAIIGHWDKSHNRMYKDDFYTLTMKEWERNKGIRSSINKPGNITPTYQFETNQEQINFLKYCNTYFARFCLSLLKNANNISVGEMKLIPWLDFTREWTDEKLYKEFDLTEEEIKFIEKNIRKYY
jgi:hypothetical protein